ncbi:enoyl-CoA delta isomerase 2, peroxisomal-like [Quercus robur]|uniref:enoyl-CoA delta isomerase 2, peroxisomal-like n=1 Tax=Quercus robur TaxID=38942 RepID=UPI002163885C|nr:enoyl-CoA delta isomerase 2, peroxisomal-like [Quercus robur]
MCILEKRGNLFILTLIDDDHGHRLGLHLIVSLLFALSQVNTKSINGSSALITVTCGKFFCNGIEVLWGQLSARLRLHQMVESFRSVVVALLSLPILTNATVSGHAAASGVVLTLGHDYVLMRHDRGFLYMSEVDLAITLPDYFSGLVRSKISRLSAARRDVLLRGMKVKGEEAVRMGIVDSVAHDSEESVVEAVVRLGDRLAERKWNGEVYAEIRKSLYPELCGVLGLVSKTVVASSKL